MSDEHATHNPSAEATVATLPRAPDQQARCAGIARREPVSPPGLEIGALLDEVADRLAERLAPRLAAGRPALEGQEKRLLDVEEAAKRLGLSPSTLYKKTKAQTIPHIKLGSRVLFDPSDLDALVALKRRTPEQVAAIARTLGGHRR